MQAFSKFMETFRLGKLAAAKVLIGELLGFVRATQIFVFLPEYEVRFFVRRPTPWWSEETQGKLIDVFQPFFAHFSSIVTCFGVHSFVTWVWVVRESWVGFI